MKKIFFSLLFSVNCNASGIFFDYKNQDIGFDSFSSDLKGLSVGYSLDKHKNVFIGFENLKSSRDIRYMGVFAGIDRNIYEGAKISLSFRSSIDIGQLNVPWFNNKNSLFSIPVGLNAQYALADNMLFNTEIGYRHFIDLTDATKCRDGSYSNSIGSGTCSHHNGVALYQDTVGDGGGIYFKFGLGYFF